MPQDAGRVYTITGQNVRPTHVIYSGTERAEAAEGK